MVRLDRMSDLQPMILSKATNELFAKYQKSNNFNYLSVAYTSFQLSKGYLLVKLNNFLLITLFLKNKENFDFVNFSEKLLNIIWGKQLSKKPKEIFHNQLFELLYLR